MEVGLNRPTHDVPPSDDLVKGGGRGLRDQTDVVSKHPWQLLLVEPLQRPIEFTQYLSMRYTDRLADAGIAPSVDSRGDAYDNALAESVIGLFKIPGTIQTAGHRLFRNLSSATALTRSSMVGACVSTLLVNRSRAPLSS